MNIFFRKVPFRDCFLIPTVRVRRSLSYSFINFSLEIFFLRYAILIYHTIEKENEKRQFDIEDCF